MITKEKAKEILYYLGEEDKSKLNDIEGIYVYGNKGRLWSNTACITNLDESKGECNPRLAFNACEPENIGCPKCIAELERLATEV